MAIVLTGDEFVALDESQGLQNTGVPSANEDNNDNDIVYTDLPAAFATRLFDAGQLSLSNAFAQANGAAQNDFISLTEGSTLTGFVKSNGDPLLAYDAGTTDPTTGVLAGFTTVDGEAIYLFADEATGLGSSMFLGVDANGDIVLAGYLQADGTISTVQFEAITNPDSGDHDDPVDLSGLLDVEATGSIDFDFDDLPSSNNLFATLGASPDGPAIVIFGADIDLETDGTPSNTSDRMFFSQAGPNATIGMNNQMFNPGDAAFFAYVNDVNAEYLSGWLPNGLTSTEADDADNALYTGGTLDVTAAKFTIAQIQGNGTGSMKLTTYLGAADTARDLLTGPTDGATSPNIIMVKVTIGAVTTTFDSDADPAVSGFDVSGLGTATVTLTGVDDAYAIEFITDGDHNRVKIEGTAGKFDIGGFVITQGITIHTPVGDRIVFEDDGPSVGDGEGTPALTVDDSDFLTDDSGTYANLFDVDFGTDGGKDSDNNGAVDDDAVAYTLGIGDGDSGLFDTLTGEEVVLSIDGLDVVGTVSGGTLEVFRISVDVNTGEVTLDQSRAVVHDDPEDHEEDGADEPSTLASADLITLTAAATDDDGDTADHTVDIGDTFNFEDDGPSMDPSGVAPPDLITDDSDIEDSDSADFSGLFTPTFGNDEGGDATTYALGVTGGPDADSGLVDVVTGEAVVLNLVSGEVVGTSATGGEVLRISVDADGNVTLVQKRAVEHDDPADHDESSSPAKMVGADLVTLTATAYDGDGDHDDATVDITSAFNFEDDGPSMDPSGVAPPDLITDDSDIEDSDSADFSGLFTPTFGNDEGGDATTYALGVTGGPDADSGLVDVVTGEAVVLNLVSGEVVGTSATGGEVLRISVDADGNVTLVQKRAVEHDDPADHDESSSPAKMVGADLVTLTATAYDGDGDHDDATVDITSAFNFEDDGPSMGLSDAPPPVLVTDDTDIEDTDTADFSGVFDPSFGNDEEGDPTTYALGVSGPDADSGLTDTLTNEAVVLNLDDITGEVIGTTADTGEVVLRISVDADGNVTQTQLRSVVHNDPDDPEESIGPAMFSAAGLVTLTATAYDGDGDHDDATANIGLSFTFEDDGPSIDRNLVEVPDLVVDESAFGSVFADFSSLFDTVFGNDGPKDTDDNDTPDDDAITYAVTISNAGDDTGLIDSLTGEAVVLDVEGLDVIGVTEIGGLEVFRVSADGETGVVTLTQSRAVKHDDPDDPDESSSPATFTSANLVSLVATAYDGDGDHDSATLDISATFKFEDDGPAIGPIAGGMVDFANGDTVSNLLGALPGADGADAKITDFTESFDFGFATVVGVQEGDQTVTYYEDENGNGSIDPGEDTAFFRLSLDTTGDDPAAWSYLFETLKDPEPASIEFNFDELPSGANLFGVVGESSSDPAILVFGKKTVVNAAGNYTNKSDVIHTSQGGTGATIGVNNQMFDPGEGAYFVYIDDPVANFLSGVPGGLSPTEADDADNVQYTGGTVDVTTASITISQMQGNKGASMKLTTFLGTAEQGRDMVLTPNGTSPNIIEVRVIKPDGTIYEFDSDSDPAIGFIDVTGLGGTSVVVTGLDKGYTVEWDTDTLHNRVLVEGVAGKFDVGKFSIGETGTTPDGQLDFEVTIEDFDTAGDTAVADFTIGIDGDLDGVITI